MKIWFESLTGKQSLLSHHLALNLEKKGHSSIFTTREYDYAHLNLERLGREHKSLGTYGGGSLRGKLIASSERIIELADFISIEQPDVLISFPSPDGHRTAFGLGIPIIQLNDTPHARAVAQLTISLADALIHPEVIKKEEFQKFGVTNFYPYKGIDEVLWIKSFHPQPQILDKYELDPHKYIVLRCEESKSAYFTEFHEDLSPENTIVTNIIEEFSKKRSSMQIIVFPRYPEQREILEKFEVIIPDVSVDTISLLNYAAATMTGGGTMAREAALLGTPSLYTFPLELKVSNFLRDAGFPIFHFSNYTIIPQKMIELSDMPKMEEEKRQKKISKLETPLSGVNRAIADIFKEK